MNHVEKICRAYWIPPRLITGEPPRHHRVAWMLMQLRWWPWRLRGIIRRRIGG